MDRIVVGFDGTATAEAALLLAVGSRGLTGYWGDMLGSVSQPVAAGSPCPVLVVPSPEVDRPSP